MEGRGSCLRDPEGYLRHSTTSRSHAIESSPAAGGEVTAGGSNIRFEDSWDVVWGKVWGRCRVDRQRV